jgi:hypothetical protein
MITENLLKLYDSVRHYGEIIYSYDTTVISPYYRNYVSHRVYRYNGHEYIVIMCDGDVISFFRKDR